MITELLAKSEDGDNETACATYAVAAGLFAVAAAIRESAPAKAAERT